MFSAFSFPSLRPPRSNYGPMFTGMDTAFYKNVKTVLTLNVDICNLVIISYHIFTVT